MFSVSTYDPWNYDSVIGSNRFNYNQNKLVPDYCVLNADRHRLRANDLSRLLQEATQHEMSSDTASVASFINHFNPEKNLWRNVESSHDVICLSTKTRGTMKNTGYLDLVVGEPFYCMPAIPSLSAMHPSENFFRYRDKTYVYPMTISGFERDRILEDLLDLEAVGVAADPKTILGEKLHKVVSSGAIRQEVDFEKLYRCVVSQSRVGVIMRSMTAARHTLYDDIQTVVPVGGVFAVEYNLFTI